MMIEELPVHPFTGLTAIGLLADGRPVWPVLGAADDDDDDDGQDDDKDSDTDDGQDDDDTDDGQDDDDAGDDDKPLGPKGERALAAMKEKLKTERTRRRAAEAKLTPDKPAEDKPDPDKDRKAAEDAATARANARILRSEVRAAAAGKLADPKDALRLLDLDQFEVDANGDVDEDEIAEAIDDLLQRKPYLAAAQSGGKKFQGSGDGGARKSEKKITEDELKRMTKPQVAKAYAEGKLSHLM